MSDKPVEGGFGPAAGSTAFQQIFDSVRGWQFQRTPSIFKAFNALAIASETTIWTPSAGKRFRLMGFLFTSGAAQGNIILRDGTAGAIIRVVGTHANVPVVPSPMEGNGSLSATINNPLTAQGVATATLNGYVFGTEE